MGLLKTAATVAVASSVHGRVQRRQQARWAAQDQAAASAMPAPPSGPYPAPPQRIYAEPASPQPGGTNDRLAQLKQLGALLSEGVLTQAEFEREQGRILNS